MEEEDEGARPAAQRSSGGRGQWRRQVLIHNLLHLVPPAHSLACLSSQPLTLPLALPPLILSLHSPTPHSLAEPSCPKAALSSVM